LIRKTLTAGDLEAIPDGGEVILPRSSLITPLARDEAARRKIRIRFAEFEEELPRPSPKHTVAIGSDHAGFELKEALKPYLLEWGYGVIDVGTDSTTAVDYPDFAQAVAEKVSAGEAWRGIVADAAGIGSAIAANKVPGARAALCYDKASARNSREHNDANVLTLGARMIPVELAREIVFLWLETPFAAGRHQKRIEKITAMEARWRKDSPKG